MDECSEIHHGAPKLEPKRQPGKRSSSMMLFSYNTQAHKSHKDIKTRSPFLKQTPYSKVQMKEQTTIQMSTAATNLLREDLQALNC